MRDIQVGGEHAIVLPANELNSEPERHLQACLNTGIDLVMHSRREDVLNTAALFRGTIYKLLSCAVPSARVDFSLHVAYKNQ